MTNKSTIKSFKLITRLNDPKFTYEDLAKAGIVVEKPSTKAIQTTFTHDYTPVSWADNAQFMFMPYTACPNYVWANRVANDYFPTLITLVNFSQPDTVIFHVKAKGLVPVATFFRYSHFFRCEALLDVFATDLPSRQNRFELTYVLLSTKRNLRIYLRVHTDESGGLTSLSSVFANANWLEREVWDMFGLAFSAHPDLRRILTDYGFFGHPLRKDFPLTGFFEIRYDDTSRRIVSEALNLIQEMRLFSFSMPWKPL